MTIDLSRLPSPAVVERLDYEAIRAALLAEFSTRWPDFSALLLESEPVVKLVELVAWLQLLNRQRVNDAARSCMLAFAGGSDLDQLAALFGVARLANEPDAALRVRTQMALEGLSTAGPQGAYSYHALSADSRVRAVSVVSPLPGQVVVTVLAHGSDGVPPTDLVRAVSQALSAETVRPLTDTVVVRPAVPLSYAVQARLDVQPGPSSEAVRAASEQGVRAYVAAAHVLGGQVTRSGIAAAAHVPGVWRVTVMTPAADVLATPAEAPWCSGVTIEVAP